LVLRPWDCAARFLEHCEAWLSEHESQNSLPLGLALRLRDGSRSADRGTRCFSIEGGGRLEGAALQTPGRSVIFTGMGREAARFAAKALPQHLEALVGCVGPRQVTDEVAQVWTAEQPGRLTLHSNLRLFELTELTPPDAVPGSLRRATEEDLELCRRWLYAFGMDCNLPEAVPGRLPERVPQIEEGSLYLWEVDGRPVACAAWARPTSEGITIGFVYTPAQWRKRGYASNLVAALSAGLLDGSLYAPARKRVNLFTDLANPTSNSIYRKLGYRPIGDQNHYLFEEKREGAGGGAAPL